MPVSVFCESTANVNAALRDSLGGGVGVGRHHHDTSPSSASASSVATSTQSLQNKLVASAKRVLLTKIEYEEVNNYSQSVLDTFKSKYIVLKPTTSTSNSINNGNASGHNKLLQSNGSSSADKASNHHNLSMTTTYTAGASSDNNGRKNPNELAQPKRILYPRENIRIGWKNPSRKWLVGVGMMNVGNTCYLNSTLQALFHVPSMANWLISDAMHMEKCESENAGCIICAMAKTLLASQSNQSAIRPYLVYSKLKSICRHLIMGRQEDAHEFLRYLVEAMEKSYLSRFRNYKELDQHSKETTPLNQILGGYLKSAVQCLTCGHVSTTFQHFQDLLLDIRKADTIEEALDGYFSRERLEDMGYKCEACKKKVSATKQFSLERAPIALCIQLKRFSMVGTKLNKQITIRPRLDLTKFASRKSTGEQFTYKLVAMVTHLGASQHCGHYTAIGLTETGTYYSFDDSYVRPISVQTVCNTNAYIIFYEMDGAPARQPTSTVTSSQSLHNYEQSKENHNTAASNNGTQSYSASSTLTSANASSPGVNPKILSKLQIDTPRMIGPHLPPVGCLLTSTTNGYGSNNGSKLVSSSTISQSPTSKLMTNRPSCIPTNSSKIMIHFKNAAVAAASTNGTLKSGMVADDITSTTPSTATATSTTNTGSKGTSKFQDSASAKYQMAGTANKAKVPSFSSSKADSNDCSDNDNDEVSSTQNDVCSSTTLPSMPKLGERPATLTLNLTPNRQKVSANVTAIASTNGLSTKSPLKSLVPYESESDEEDSNAGSSLNADDDDSTKKKIKAKQLELMTANVTASIKNATTTTTPKEQLQSKIKQKTDEIDKIFNGKKQGSSNNTNNYNKTNTNNNNSSISSSISSSNISNSNLNNKSSMGGPSPQKKFKPNHNSDDDNDDLTVDEFTCSRSNNATSSMNNGFNRSKSTPPSPPVIKTKTGIWQVTAVRPSSASASSPPEKKIRNPFDTQKAETNLFAASRRQQQPNKTAIKKRFPTNGYQKTSDNGADDDKASEAINELLKQSHRGYGAPVLSWNGTKTEMEKEITEENRLQRKREWEEEDETEMDRGRSKKIKSVYNGKSSSNLGYNPFQEQQNQQNNGRRWKGGSASGGFRFKNGASGSGNFQSGNNFKRYSNGSNNHYNNNNNHNSSNSNHNNNFRRFNNKFTQRPHHQRIGGSNDFHRRES